MTRDAAPRIADSNSPASTSKSSELPLESEHYDDFNGRLTVPDEIIAFGSKVTRPQRINVFAGVCRRDSHCTKGKYCGNKAGKNQCLSDGGLKLGAKCSKDNHCKSGKCQGLG